MVSHSSRIFCMLVSVHRTVGCEQRAEIVKLHENVRRRLGIPFASGEEQEQEYETLKYLDFALLALGAAVSALMMRASRLRCQLGHLMRLSEVSNEKTR